MNGLLKSAAFKVLSVLSHNGDGKIVFYHDLHREAPKTNMSTPFSLFLKHVAEATDHGFRFVNHVPEQEKTVQVCLDDGFSGVWDVRNELCKMNILPTVYIAVDLIGKPGYLTREQILNLQGMGFTFECHTWTHRGLTEIAPNEWRREIVDSKKWLADFLQKEILQLCFPKGLFSRPIYEMSLEAGYDQLVSSIPGSVKQGFAPRILPRNLVQFYSAAEYVNVLNGALGMVRARYRRLHTKGDF